MDDKDKDNLETVNGDHEPSESGLEQGQDGTKDDAAGKLKPPDGGYGWFVVLGCFLSHCVTGGLERSDGVFFLQFLEKFGHSAQLTAWPGAIVSTVRLLMGPIASAVCNRYSARSSVMVGSVLVALGCILNGLAPNLYFLFFSHSLVAGLGRGLSYAPGLILLGMYFDKKRSLSAGLATSGVGVGTFLIVPLAQYLFDTYGFQGAFLIIGGYALNMLVVGMLYRPLSMNYKFTKHSKRTVANENVAQMDTEAAIVLTEQCQISDKDGIRLSHQDTDQSQYFEEMQSLDESTSKHVTNDRHVYAENKPKSRNCLTSSFKICFPVENKGKDARATKKLFHFYLLKNPSFTMYCLSIWLFTMASKAAFTFIPALVKSKDISESQAALVLSVTGVADTVGRIGTGILLDTRILRPIRPLLYNLIMLVVSTVAFILPSLDTFSAFCALCFVYGLFTGGYVSQKSVILVDILDVKHMANSFGILICFQGLGTLIGPPLSGALKDYFGSYDEAFYLGGGLMVAAGCCMLLGNILLRLQKRKESE